MVRLEQERAEVAYRHEEDERRRKREQAKRVKRMLEAAFDGDTTEIKALLSEVSVGISNLCIIVPSLLLRGNMFSVHSRALVRWCLVQ